MLLDHSISKHARYEIFDCTGNLIGFVKTFNTKTCELECMLPLGKGNAKHGSRMLMEGDPNQNNVKSIKFVLKGAYALDPDTGQKLK